MSKNFFFILTLVLLVVGIISSISLLNHSFKTATRNKELQNKILNAQLQFKEQELNYLKHQIHPHFLFNTLNTIYGFALKQSKQTPDIILKLSNLLDYILYQVNKPRVALFEEVMHIKEYIGLEKMRFEDSLKVIFMADDFNDRMMIAPMLLIPFVENAFKHGRLFEGYLHIEISVNIKENDLIFTVRNSYIKNDVDNNGKGIGLENIKKRLEINYPGNYSLTIKRDNYWFETCLVVNNLKMS